MFHLPLKTLTDMLASTMQAAEMTGFLPRLNGVHFEWKQDADADTGLVTMVATDRHQLVIAEVSSTSVHEEGTFDVSMADLQNMVRMLPRVTRRTRDMDVRLDGRSGFSVEWTDDDSGGMFYCPTISDDYQPYPKWQSFAAVPEEPKPTTVIALNPRLLASTSRIRVSQGTPWTFSFNGPSEPVIAKPQFDGDHGDPRYTFILMPIRLA